MKESSAEAFVEPPSSSSSQVVLRSSASLATIPRPSSSRDRQDVIHLGSLRECSHMDFNQNMIGPFAELQRTAAAAPIDTSRLINLDTQTTSSAPNMLLQMMNMSMPSQQVEQLQQLRLFLRSRNMEASTLADLLVLARHLETMAPSQSTMNLAQVANRLMR
jgi:hypothetical protein|mmetsp:Transcript_107191/g.167409  ORF Transcript_107191/g.167409 Transcript_107191/m.167409 type:complete len:162 (+) Transcript_107191:399-884(+)